MSVKVTGYNNNNNNNNINWYRHAWLDELAKPYFCVF